MKRNRTETADSQKRTGRFCTPEPLTRRVVEETLRPLLSRLPVESLARLRVLDPAMGDGNFLLEVGRQICREILGRSPAGTTARADAIRRKVFSGCLFGVDTDRRAVAAARARLAAAGGLGPGAERRLGDHLMAGDSLRDPFPIREPGRFDVILGNPPYIGFKLWSQDGDLVERLRRSYKSFHQHADLFYFFIERGLGLLAPGGRMGLVTSRYFMRSPSAEGVRRIALPSMVEFIDLDKSGAFADLGIHCAISIYEPSAGKADRAAFIGRPPRFGVPVVALKDVADVRAGLQSGRDAVFVKAVSERGGRFFGLCADGATVELEADLIRPFLKNGDILPYFAAPKRWCLFTGDGLAPGRLERRYPGAYRFLKSHKATLMARRSSYKAVTEENWTEWMHWAEPHFAAARIVCPYRARSNRFALAPPRALGSIDVGFIVPRCVHPMYLLALLNSQVIERAYQGYAKELEGGVYDYYPRNLSLLPIRRVEEVTPRRERGRLVGEFLREDDPQEALAWLRQDRPDDVLRDALIALAEEAVRREGAGLAAARWRCDRIVEKLYRC